jgi:hypothetical protein
MQSAGHEPPNKGQKFQGEPLTGDEMRACSQRASGRRPEPGAATVMYQAGLRGSEAPALRPANIDPGDEHGPRPGGQGPQGTDGRHR